MFCWTELPFNVPVIVREPPTKGFIEMLVRNVSFNGFTILVLLCLSVQDTHSVSS